MQRITVYRLKSFDFELKKHSSEIDLMLIQDKDNRPIIDDEEILTSLRQPERFEIYIAIEDKDTIRELQRLNIISPKYLISFSDEYLNLIRVNFNFERYATEILTNPDQVQIFES